MKLFISIPMAGKTEEQIRSEMQTIYESYKRFGNDIELIDSVLDYKDKSPLWCLGESIKLMSQPDTMIHFAEGWQNSRGCRIEHDCAVDYKKNIVHE